METHAVAKIKCIPFRGLKLFALFFAGVLLLAAILAPILFLATAALAEMFSIGTLHHFLSKGFGKFFDRSKLIAFAVLLYPLLRLGGIKSWTSLRFKKISPKGYLSFAAGVLVAFAIFALLRAISAPSQSIFRPGALGSASYEHIKPIAAAFVIGFLEETIFRGIIFELLSRDLGKIAAGILTSLFFAYCHTGTRSRGGIDQSSVTIFSGFQCIIPAAIGIFHNFNPINFLNLTTFGILLSVLMLECGSILHSILFHAGVVFAVNFAGAVPFFGTQMRAIEILNTWTTFSCQWLAIGVLLAHKFHAKWKKRNTTGV
ncbi:MAG: CPBP family intramembrane metalloprotease [Puniceicoccales bacterium]|jgi:membrane protease YdiL (CAAX protease family)|nr:CPBP family intramembrane metalloprotease [Puniceicoccales bacterium]